MTVQFKSVAFAVVAAMGLTACVDEQVSSGASSVGLNRNVVIENQTGETIWRFYGSRVATNSWEEDILGSSVLGNGRAINIDFDDGTGACNFDMKAEFQDGRSIERFNVNVCTATRVTFR